MNEEIYREEEEKNEDVPSTAYIEQQYTALAFPHLYNTLEIANQPLSYQLSPVQPKELQLLHSNTGKLIGSIVWDGGRVLMEYLEYLCDKRVVNSTQDGFIHADSTRHSTQCNCIQHGTSRYDNKYTFQYNATAAFPLPRNFLNNLSLLDLGAG